MSTLKLLRAELWHRKMNGLLTLLALVSAATLFVACPTLLESYQVESNQQLQVMQEETAADLAEMQAETEAELKRMQLEADQSLADLEKKTRRTMRDLGFNLRIVHRNTDMNQLYAEFVSFDMPEEYVQRLADSPEITKIVHLVASLRQMVQWQWQQRLLIGFAPEATQSHIEQKSPMGFRIEQGQVYLGSLVGKGHAVGDSVEILGKSFEVTRILEPHGRADEDIAICMHLKDAQTVLDKPGKISEILALGCKCKTIDRVEEITAQLELVLPEAKVSEYRVQAMAREEQRKLVEKYHTQRMQAYKADQEKITSQERQRLRETVNQAQARREDVAELLSSGADFLTPLIVLGCAVWVGLLAWTNVRERRTEIGLLRAIGKGSGNIASLLLGKALVLGLAAGLVGCLAGYFVARWLSTSVLNVAIDNFTPSMAYSACAILGTPLLAAVASYLPTLSAVNQDPAVVLLEG